ncbi:hypothetical protein EDD37DRAFT_654662 [Exophiala viscosa]|uniref:uncharacterized protein n=1 Tax=Exophiala viscosa TaxID=2486360 RepID=UPI00218CFD4B|nr:hypothetical protein EDD37DRAFT_654662 [Exophiala viscosa]
MQTPEGEWRPTISSQRQDTPAQKQSTTPENNVRTPRQLLPRPQDPSTDELSSLALDRYQRRHRTNVTVACDQCKLKRVKCNGRNPCSRCSIKALDCTFEQGTDGRRGRNSSSELQTLLERVDSYDRFFQILRSSSSADAVRILHHMRSQHKDNTSDAGSTEDAALSATLRFAESLSSQPATPSGPPPLSPLDWQRHATSSVSDTASASAMSDAGTQNPSMRSGTGLADPLQSFGVPNHFPMSGFGSAITTAKYSTTESESHIDNVPPSGSSVSTTSPKPREPTTNPFPWLPRSSTNFRQANKWLHDDLSQASLWLSKESDKHRTRRGRTPKEHTSSPMKRR